MRVVLLEEWMGHPKGSVKDLRNTFAKTLLDRGVAKEVSSPPVNKMQKKEKTKEAKPSLEA